MIALNAHTAALVTTAMKHLAKNVPRKYLSRVGLAKTAPAIAPLPLAGMIAGGALATALVVPQSRRWIISKVGAMYGAARSALLLDEESEDSEEAAEGSAKKSTSESASSESGDGVSSTMN